MVLSLCENNGHRGKVATKSIIKEEYECKAFKEDMSELVQNCLLCLILRTGEKIPRLLGTALHGQNPKQVALMVYLHVEKTDRGNLKYVFVIKDDLTSYKGLTPATDPGKQMATDWKAKWIAAFGSIDWLVLYEGAHFTALVMSQLDNKTYSAIGSIFYLCGCLTHSAPKKKDCREVKRVWKVSFL